MHLSSCLSIDMIATVVCVHEWQAWVYISEWVDMSIHGWVHGIKYSLANGDKYSCFGLITFWVNYFVTCGRFT